MLFFRQFWKPVLVVVSVSCMCQRHRRWREWDDSSSKEKSVTGTLFEQFCQTPSLHLLRRVVQETHITRGRMKAFPHYIAVEAASLLEEMPVKSVNVAAAADEVEERHLSESMKLDMEERIETLHSFVDDISVDDVRQLVKEYKGRGIVAERASKIEDLCKEKPGDTLGRIAVCVSVLRQLSACDIPEQNVTCEWYRFALHMLPSLSSFVSLYGDVRSVSILRDVLATISNCLYYEKIKSQQDWLNLCHYCRDVIRNGLYNVDGDEGMGWDELFVRVQAHYELQKCLNNMVSVSMNMCGAEECPKCPPDVTFLGKYSVLDHDHYAIDIVCVHGLHGDDIWTWTSFLPEGEDLVEKSMQVDCGVSSTFSCQQKTRTVEWPTKWLQHDIHKQIGCACRVVSVSYFSSILPTGENSSSSRDVSDNIKKQLLACGVGKKPVIFLCHSFGGAMTMTLLLEDKENAIRGVTAGCVLFSAPLWYSSLVEKIHVRKGPYLKVSKLVQEFLEDEEKVRKRREQFTAMCFKNDISVLCITEDKPITIFGVSFVAVPPEYGYLLDFEVAHYPGATHQTVNKPFSQYVDVTYLKVVDFCCRCVVVNVEDGPFKRIAWNRSESRESVRVRGSMSEEEMSGVSAPQSWRSLESRLSSLALLLYLQHERD